MCSAGSPSPGNQLACDASSRSQENTQCQEDHLQQKKSQHADGNKVVKLRVWLVVLRADQGNTPGDEQQHHAVKRGGCRLGGDKAGARDRERQ